MIKKKPSLRISHSDLVGLYPLKINKLRFKSTVVTLDECYKNNINGETQQENLD